MNLNSLIDFEGLSTEAKIGKIVVLVAFVLKIVGLLFLVSAISLGGYTMMAVPMGMGFGALWTGIMIGLLILGLIGLFLIWKAFGKMEAKDFHGAAIYSLIAAFLPPLDIIVLIGAILLFISPEAKK